MANTVSPTAAPRPDTKPLSGPKARVRRMQIRFTGPMGTATISPITTPETMRSRRSIPDWGLYLDDQAPAHLAGEDILRRLAHAGQRDRLRHGRELADI